MVFCPKSNKNGSLAGVGLLQSVGGGSCIRAPAFWGRRQLLYWQCFMKMSASDGACGGLAGFGGFGAGQVLVNFTDIVGLAQVLFDPLGAALVLPGQRLRRLI